MRDVGQEIGADLIGDSAESGEIDRSRIGAGPADDQFGFASEGLLADGVVVQQEAFAVHAVLLDLEELARKGHLGPVRDVARPDPSPG